MPRMQARRRSLAYALTRARVLARLQLCCVAMWSGACTPEHVGDSMPSLNAQTVTGAEWPEAGSFLCMRRWACYSHAL